MSTDGAQPSSVPIRGMHDEDELLRRIERLEERAVFTEDLLDRLDDLVTRQTLQIESLTRELARVSRAQDDQGPTRAAGARDEIPPHW
jgi:SlyX protein